MSHPGGGDDPATLERAAREFHAIAKSARVHASRLAEYAATVKPVAQGVSSVIGGTATGSDKQMVGTLNRTVRDLRDAAERLTEASVTAGRLAQESAARAKAARDAQAARPPHHRR